MIQPHLPIRLPCYDFTLVIGSTFGSSSLAVRSLQKEDTIDFLKEMVRFPHISVEGLMTIGPHVSDEEQIRAVFRELRLLKEEINALALPAVKMRELSMGMSSDYPAAVREGATMVRVGTTIFGARSVK